MIRRMSDAQEQAGLMVTRVLWFSLLTSQLMFVFILWFVRWRAGTPSIDPPDRMMLPVLGFAASTTTVLSLIIPGRILANVRKNLPGNDAATRGKRAVAERSAWLVGCAMAESVSLMGFVVGFLGFPPLTSVPFFLVSFLLFGARFPAGSGAGTLER
jgi:hypothetical protein